MMMLGNIAQTVSQTFSQPVKSEQNTILNNWHEEVDPYYNYLRAFVGVHNIIMILAMTKIAWDIHHNTSSKQEKSKYLLIASKHILASVTLTAIPLMFSPPTNAESLSNIVKYVVPYLSTSVSTVSAKMLLDIKYNKNQ